MLVVPNEGKIALADLLNSGGGLAGITLDLYKNSVILDNATVFGDFSLANFSGYASDSPTFGSATLVSNKARIEDSSEREFEHNGGATPNDIYGYIVHDGSTCFWAEALGSPFTVENAGDKVKVLLRLTLVGE